MVYSELIVRSFQVVGFVTASIGDSITRANCYNMGLPHAPKNKLHSAGHLLDICMRTVGLGNLEPGKGYHFPDGPFVEYKGVVPQNELQGKQKELELDANALISRGGKVSAVVLPYAEAVELCGGCLPDYIPKSSNPRILKLGDNPGCPCGGTHVSDISEIISVKVKKKAVQFTDFTVLSHFAVSR
ncbi:hypothetical protein CK203_001544 [Vitis vinifera]|uniref:Threonyl/alanyl tRNA synthetase SAD domain-containing protein n=1 Tax=Vitis vinifera TaxID=29760 RepID=A0A438KKU0_VITVI|nr:hypothetical protein CK203_001544 [Vitis vinifera]